MNKKLSYALMLAVSATFSVSAFAADRSGVTCANLPTFADLQAALAIAVPGAAGLGLPMWATLVDSSGRVCAVAKLNGSDPWPGSRVIYGPCSRWCKVCRRSGRRRSGIFPCCVRRSCTRKIRGH